MAKKREPVWATRLRDLLRDFVAAKKRSRLRFVLVQTIGAEVKDLQPSVDENCSRTRTAVTLGDGTPAVRWAYRFGRDNDPAVALIKRGNDILKRHGDEILKLFGLKFVDSWECSWPWLLARLAEVEHPFRGDIKVERTLAGVAGPKMMAEAVAFWLGQGPQPNWLAERNKSFRADIPHVAVASIAAIRAILERVDSLSAAKDMLGSRTKPTTLGGEQQPPNPPKVYLSSWREILAALSTEKDKVSVRQVRAAHKLVPGPIILPTQGGQPMPVVKADLLIWWSGLEDRYRELATARDSLLADRSATLENQFDLGRGEHQETVVPEIAGSVKGRRGST